MARRITAGDEVGASHSQNRAIELTLTAFRALPRRLRDRAGIDHARLFGRGAFTEADAHAAALTLMAYAIGLLPFVLMRSVTATFLSRGDTSTPVKALFVAVAVNVALKILLMDRFAQVGLAFATSVGTGSISPCWSGFPCAGTSSSSTGACDSRAPNFAIAARHLGRAAAWRAPGRGFVRGLAIAAQRDDLLVLAVIGAIIYGIAIRALFNREWRDLMRGRPGSTQPPSTVE